MNGYSRPHCGETAAHSCVLSITEARAAAMDAEVTAQRARLDAPYAFGRNAGAEFPYQSENSYRGRVAPHPVLYPKFDRLPTYTPAVQGHGGIGPGYTTST